MSNDNYIAKIGLGVSKLNLSDSFDKDFDQMDNEITDMFYNNGDEQKKGEYALIIRKEIDLDKPLTDEQKIMLEKLKSIPSQPDEDCPELTDEQLRQMVKKVRNDVPNADTIAAIQETAALKTATGKKVYSSFEEVLTELEDDPFYSSENMERLRRSAEQMEENGGTIHEVGTLLDD